MMEAAELLFRALPCNGHSVELSYIGTMLRLSRPSKTMTWTLLVQNYYPTWFRIQDDANFEPCVGIRRSAVGL